MSTEPNISEPSDDSPQTTVMWAKKNIYAIVIVLLIGLIAFMIYPSICIYIFLAFIIPVIMGVCTEMIFQTEYFKSLNYQLSRLEKTAIVSGVVGSAGLSMGFFSGNILERLESVIKF
jgi:uncharacterized membrane protein YeaQ/YmgE (transglycosylase-associated protein family)